MLVLAVFFGLTLKIVIIRAPLFEQWVIEI